MWQCCIVWQYSSHFISYAKENQRFLKSTSMCNTHIASHYPNDYLENLPEVGTISLVLRLGIVITKLRQQSFMKL